ncbi:hypothetical protein QVD17_33498 [Tagetes erecta]|uniref:Harbinger transposase-derived protein n=1 Tax=Tagetes erecta TaxID=13708 RepID=A0AAD8JYG5_TARER|nr:hypothetical protein QVD17_33498 [Tagetes erecta]
MSSSSSQLYNRLLNDDDDTSSDEYEEEMAVTSAMSFVVRGLFEETENTTNPIRKELFLRIVNDLESDDSYFKQKRDARGLLGFTGIQKCTSALRVLAYGNTTDINDEYLQMSEKTTRDTLEHFTKGIIKIYGQRYLRKPTWNDLQRIYEVHQEVHGLPGMIGSIDCMHWEWFNCPTAWRGQHTRGDQGVPTLMLQAVASYDLWIWHAHFGTAGSNNDLNVLEESSIIEDVDDGNAICQNYIPDQVEEEITQATFEERVANDAYLRNKHEHYALMADLIEHAWSVRTIPDNDDDAS